MVQSVIGFAFSVNVVEAGGGSAKMVNTKSAFAVAPEQWEIDLTLEKTRHIGTPQYTNSWGTRSRSKVRLWDWQVTAKYGLQEGTDVFISAGIGAKVQLAENYELLVGYDYPETGRNSLRAQSWKVGITGSF